MKSRDRVAIGWLDPGQVDGMFMLSVMNVYGERRDRIDGLIRVNAGGLLSRGRNELVEHFLTRTESQWLLMIDSDEQLGLDTFDKLIGAVHNKERPIMAGLYFGLAPGEPYPTGYPLIFRRVKGSTRFMPIADYPDDQVIEIDSAGTGCLLIHRSVFEAFQAEASEHEGPMLCWFRDMPVNRDWFSEDHYFCSRAQELGYRLHAHTGAILPHHKSLWLTERHFR